MSPNLNYFIILGCYLIFASSLPQLPTNKFEILNFFCKVEIDHYAYIHACLLSLILSGLSLVVVMDF